jgi:hypothetical protein
VLVDALFGSLDSRRSAPPSKSFSHSLSLLPSHPTRSHRRPHAIRHAFSESARTLPKFSDTNTPGPCRGHECTRFMRTRPHSFDYVPSTFIHWAVAISHSLYLSIKFRELTPLVIYTFSCRASFPSTPATVLVAARISSPSSHFSHTSLLFQTLYSFVLLRLCIHDILLKVCFLIDDRPPPPSLQSGAPYSTYFHAHGTPLLIERVNGHDGAE